MVHPSTPRDTTPDALSEQVAAWRVMSIADRVEMIRAVWENVYRLTLAGIAAADIDEGAVLEELARRRYGRRLADEVYGPHGARR